MIEKTFTVTKSYTVDAVQIEEIKDYVFGDWMGMQLTTQQVIDFLEEVEDASLFENIELDIDTVTREHIMGLVGEKFVGRPWPTGGTLEKETEKFFKELYVAVKDYGWQIDQPINY